MSISSPLDHFHSINPLLFFIAGDHAVAAAVDAAVTMASISILSLLLPLLLLLSAADARPCKTLFISSFYYSFPTTDRPSLQIRASSFTVYRVSRSDLQPTLSRTISFHRPLVSHAAVADEGFPFGSLRERARDIMAVVVGLLFGVGCGALTAAIIYCVWSVVTNRFDFCFSASDDLEEDEVPSPKKMGYVTISAVEPVAPIKEGYEGKY